MKSIGGYFELELGVQKSEENYPNIFKLNSGRHALEFILNGIDNINRLFIPYYTCEVVLEPIKRKGLDVVFYKVDENLEIVEGIIESLESDDYIIINNYFGVKDFYINQLVLKYSEKINQFIIDAAQSYFYANNEIPYIFYSPRKFIGIPDGGIALVNSNLKEYERIYNGLIYNISHNKFSHLLKRIEFGAQEGYKDFRENSKVISSENMEKMSNLTNRILNTIEFESIKNIRLKNFYTLNLALQGLNEFKFLSDLNFECPMIYPFFLKDKGFDLRQFLIKNEVFCPLYWPNVKGQVSVESVELSLIEDVVFIPIDQRYNTEDMEYIVKLINEYVYK